MVTEFAKRFTELRQAQNYTQQSIAERLGVTPQAVSKWEKGASLPDVEMLKSIAVFLNCSMDYLMGHRVTKENQISMEALERKNEIERAMVKDVLELTVGKDLIEMLLEAGKEEYREIHELRKRIARRYGVPVPVIRMRDELSLGEKEYRILIYGREVAAGRVEYPLYFHAGQTAEGPEEIEAVEPVRQQEGVWKAALTPEDGKNVEKMRPTPLSAMQVICSHMEQVIVENYELIINRQMVADMVELVHRDYPAVTEGVVPEKVSYSTLQRAIVEAVKEGSGVPSMVRLIERLEDEAVIQYCKYTTPPPQAENQSTETFFGSAC